MIKPPVFEGLPSPSIQKMQRMPRQRLQEHLAMLEQQRVLLAARLERLRKVREVDPKDPRVQLEGRLAKLIDAGKKILESGPGSFRPAGPRRFSGGGRRFDRPRPGGPPRA